MHWGDEVDTCDSPPLPTLGPVLDFMRLIWAMDHALQRTSKRMMMELGVTGSQRLVLHLIGRFPCISAGQLSRVLHLHPSTLTGIIRRLERRGLVRRRRDPQDGRRSFLGLTVKGHRIDVRTEGTIEAAIQKSLSGFPPKTVDAARQVFTELTRVLEEGRPKKNIPNTFLPG